MRAYRVLLFSVAGLLPLSFGDIARGIWIPALLLVFVVAFVTGRIAEPRRAIVWVVAALAAAGAGIVTSAEAIDRADHWTKTTTMVVLFICAPPVLTWVTARPAVLSGAVRSFVVVQTISAALAVTVAITGSSLLGVSVVQRRVEGLAGHPNVLGLMAVVVALIWLDRLLTGTGSTLLTVAAGVNTMALLFSGSISSLGALAAGAAVLAVAHRVPIAAVVKVGVAGLLVLIVATRVAEATGVIASPIDRVRQTSGQTEQISTLEIRQRTWSFAIERIAASPVEGVGLDDVSGRIGVGEPVVHNLLLRSWFQGGPLLGLAMLALVASGVRATVRSIRSRRNCLSAGVLVAFVAFSMTSAALQQPYFWLIFIVCWTQMQGLLRPGYAVRPTPAAFPLRQDVGT